MKKGQKIIGISGIILAISVASIACQKNNTETEKIASNETKTTLEYVETIGTEEEIETEKKETSEEKETKKADKKSDNNKKETEAKETSEKENKPQKPAETKPGNSGSKPQKPVETQKPSKPAETKPQESQKPAETKPVETQHKHNWVEQTQQVNHKAEGHYETVIIQAAWDEPIYESHNFCNDCGKDLGNAYNAGLHLLESGHNSYYSERVQVGTKHHDAVTEQKWVEDKAAWTETVVVGYKCSTCGDTKK